MNKTLLELKNITVGYDDLTVLSSVNLQIQSNEVVALMGPNGAGKSTVLKAMFGLVLPQSGEVFWEGDTIMPKPHEMIERGISFVPQGRRVFHSLSVTENIEIGGFLIKNRHELARRCHDVLELFPALQHKRLAKAGSLSGGQQQMVAIARGLMSNPKLLLLDEPTLGLAPKVIQELFASIEAIYTKQGMSIVIVEHNIKSLMTIADRGYILDQGKVVAEGLAQDLKNKGVMEKVVTGTLDAK